MSTKNCTFRLTDDLREWLGRNDQSITRQLERDLETLQILAKLAERDKKKLHTLRGFAEDFGLI